jgi:glycosyltransferase involved in cell wall biosynthesis
VGLCLGEVFEDSMFMESVVLGTNRLATCGELVFTAVERQDEKSEPIPSCHSPMVSGNVPTGERGPGRSPQSGTIARVGEKTPSNRLGRTRAELKARSRSCDAGRVSVVIPCYNSRAHVGAAIESALGQTWRDVEVIVVDDGSNDGSRDVLADFGDRIQVVSRDRGGAPAARNSGLAVASGEFIQFLDADDLLLADAVQRRLVVFEGGIDAVFGDLEFFDDRTGRTLRASDYRGWPESESLAELIGNNLYTETPLHRRSLLYEAGGFDEGLPCSQELNLNIRLFLAGARFVYLPGTVARARVHEAPDRIENAPWYVEDPRRHLRIVEHHRRLIAAANEELLSPAVDRALAFKLWSRGVIAGRNGAFDTARLHFDRARGLASPLRPEGSPLFRLAHAVVGPLGATWFLYQKQRLQQRFAGLSH